MIAAHLFVRVASCGRAPGFLPPEHRLEVALSDAKELNSGAAASLNGLYRRYSGWLGQRLRGRVGVDEAADVVQETYLRIAPYLLDEIRHPKALLLRVALNLVRDERRRLSLRDRALGAAAPLAPSFSDSPVDRLLLKQILLTMPPLYRDVFVLSRFDGMTYSEIALAQGISLATVERRMARAVEHCMAQLDV
ncbi:RNA polymerase sigma factor [Brevundimonas sp.]|uniref:RNA polymerase sigma factor n=1 Tax=Brevundimonas sp. TaxID=1871086 RepID=UPI0037C0D0E8